MTPRALSIIRDEHRSVAAMLRALDTLVQQSQGAGSPRFFDAARAMLYYIDEFPERLHHPKESDLLFPKLLRRDPTLMPVIERLEHDHLTGEPRVRGLQHLLLSWELLGPSRREAFVTELRSYLRFYLDHMRCEESEVLPRAIQLLDAADWRELDASFSAHSDPGVQHLNGETAPEFEKLFARIVSVLPEPAGFGQPL